MPMYHTIQSRQVISNGTITTSSFWGHTFRCHKTNKAPQQSTIRFDVSPPPGSALIVVCCVKLRENYRAVGRIIRNRFSTPLIAKLRLRVLSQRSRTSPAFRICIVVSCGLSCALNRSLPPFVRHVAVRKTLYRLFALVLRRYTPPFGNKK